MTERPLEASQKTKRPFVLAAVMVAMFIGAIEATIVATAMPAVVADLGGFAQYSWVFSAFLLMNTVTVLIYGKLSDLYGRKIIFTIGVCIFLIGSMLCGFSVSMEQLIVFRLIQGIGAGAVMPIATTIVGDIYTGDERAHIQGYLSSVWGISAIMGPAVGGLLVEYASWRWVFWVSIPLGLLSLAGVWLFLDEKLEKRKPKIDYTGALLMTATISSLMFVLVEGGVRYSWSSPVILSVILIAASALVLFLIHEKRASEPMVPLDIWRQKPILIANLVTFTTGVMLIGISSFLPAYVQGVMEESATIAGFTLTTMSIGWPIASTLTGMLMPKIGYRATSVLGGIFLILGGSLFVVIVPEAGPLGAALASFCFGAGMGLTSTSFIVLIQGSVDWKQRGITTASNMFMRNLGNTVGAAALGGILNTQILRFFSEKGTVASELTLDSTNQLLTEEQRSDLTTPIKEVLQQGLSFSLHSVYLAVLVFGLISFVLVLFLPGKLNKQQG